MREQEPTDWVGIMTGAGIMVAVATAFFFAVSLFSG